jgi:hypothetical protein
MASPFGMNLVVAGRRRGHAYPGQILALAGPAPASAVITWTSGQLRCSVATLSGQVRATAVSRVRRWGHWG